jgi:endonuclease/exonuclease/phosphatase family metal-dependent hydrolase
VPVVRLAVGSYNIHGGVGSDGRHDLARIGRVVSALDADIVALQEVGGGQAAEAKEAAHVLSAATGLMAIQGPTIRRSDGDFGNVLLTRLPPEAVRLIDLSFRNREPRGALDVRFQVAGGSLRVIATHLGLLPLERRFQVKRLIEVVRAGESGDEAATLLLGDINEWFALGRPLRWLHGYFRGRAHGGRTFPSRFPLFALDRIWVHPKAALSAYEVRRDPEAREASDHLPVRVEIDLPIVAAAP